MQLGIFDLKPIWETSKIPSKDDFLVKSNIYPHHASISIRNKIIISASQDVQ
jgi:hypothetical protein